MDLQETKTFLRLPRPGIVYLTSFKLTLEGQAL